jgi:ATP-dependent phosphofructokinase / diphosphate-dependent phosphofructokinase
MAKTSTKVFILEVMGRHAGWIAAAGGLASTQDTEIPIVILFPEVTFDKDKFLAKVNAKV